MKCIAFFAFLCLACLKSNAQSAEDSVKTIINQLFAAMKNSDAVLLQASFADSAILQTITATGQIRTEDVGDFARQIARLEKGVADERITFDVVKIDENLAVAWTPYQFFYKGQFSHCGVDSFQLVRVNGQWKIQYLIDTRRKTSCK